MPTAMALMGMRVRLEPLGMMALGLVNIGRLRRRTSREHTGSGIQLQRGIFWVDTKS